MLYHLMPCHMQAWKQTLSQKEGPRQKGVHKAPIASAPLLKFQSFLNAISGKKAISKHKHMLVYLALCITCSIMHHVSCIPGHPPCIMHHARCTMQHVPCMMYHVSCIIFHAFCSMPDVLPSACRDLFLFDPLAKSMNLL